jgi:hypothetical protein
MKSFWPIYLASVVVGTAAVYVAAPLARPALARWRGVEEAAPAPEPAAQPAPAAPAVAKAEARPARAAPPPQPAQAHADDDTPPAMLGVYLASHGDRPGWGVTSQRTTYYKLDGARQGTVPGGILFTIVRAHQSSKGAMLECAFLQNSVTNGPFLVSRKDVNLFTASHTVLSKRQLDALLGFYSLSGKVGVRKNELLQASAAKNPHFAAANAAYQAYLAHIAQAKELASKRETATELDKARLEDQLRELKVAEVKLKATLDAANLKFREWKQQHASEVAKPENDPDIKRWTAEMATLRSVVPGLAM